MAYVQVGSGRVEGALRGVGGVDWQHPCKQSGLVEDECHNVEDRKVAKIFTRQAEEGVLKLGELYPAWALILNCLSCSSGSSSPYSTQTLNSRLQISEATINTGAAPQRHKDYSLRRNALNVLTVGSNAFQSIANLEFGRLDEDQCAPF